MYEELVILLRNNADHYMTVEGAAGLVHLIIDAADAIENLSKRIDRAVKLYNLGAEKSAMWEALEGISPEPPKEEKA